MAMNLKPAKAKSKTSFMQNVLVIGLVVALIATVMIVNAASSAALDDKVSIAVLKESLPKDGIIPQCESKDYDKYFEKQDILRAEYIQLHEVKSGKKNSEYAGKEFNSYREIILWEDLPILCDEGIYAACYIPSGRPLYFEDFTKTGTQKNSYLYQMDGELIRLDITPDDFGDMIVPGDKLNIRISYETNDYTLPTQTEYAKLMEQGGTVNETVFVTEMLFSEVAILDMINGSGESIFDLYYELLTLPEAQRSSVINSDDFKSRVAPSNILLSVTAEEADRYARIKNMGGDYLITLLPRDGTTEILDALDELQTGFARD